MSSLLFRSLGIGTNLIKTPSKLYQPLRYAGHAKWQNIKGTKLANDLAKGRLISRYVLMVRKAIVTNKMISDPKLNNKLAAVLAEANKFNVPKATLDRAIARSANVKMVSCTVEIQGTEGWSMIVKAETDNKSFLRRDIRKAIKKFDSGLVPDDTINSMFKSQGFIRTTTKAKDGNDVSQDSAEEAAIMSGAEEVFLESYGDENVPSVWCFSTSEETLNACKGELEKQGLQVISAELEYKPHREVDFGPEVSNKVQSILEALEEFDQIEFIAHNVLIHSENDD